MVLSINETGQLGSAVWELHPDTSLAEGWCHLGIVTVVDPCFANVESYRLYIIIFLITGQ